MFLAELLDQISRSSISQASNNKQEHIRFNSLNALIIDFGMISWLPINSNNTASLAISVKQVLF